MVKKKASDWVTLGSTLTGIGLGLFITYWLTFTQLPIISNIPFYVFLTLGGVIGGLFGYAIPRPTEGVAFAVSAYIIFQFIWDSTVEPNVGPVRIALAWRALLLFITNSVGGHYRVDKAIKVILNALGLGK